MKRFPTPFLLLFFSGSESWQSVIKSRNQRSWLRGPMGIVPLCVWGHFHSADNRDGLVARSEQPVLPELIEKRRNEFRRLQDESPYFLERIVKVFRIFKSVYCPSTPRHIESATVICEVFKLPAPIPDPRLNTVDYGNLKGQPRSSMRPPHDYVEIPHPGGESWLQCLGRWRAFF